MDTALEVCSTWNPMHPFIDGGYSCHHQCVLQTHASGEDLRMAYPLTLQCT
jgi:hypothetical protein